MYFDYASAVFTGHREGMMKQNFYINCFYELEGMKTHMLLII